MTDFSAAPSPDAVQASVRDVQLPRYVAPLRPLVLTVARIPATIHSKLRFGFLVSALLLLALSLLSFGVLRQMNARVQDLNRLHSYQGQAEQMLYDVTSQMHFREMSLWTHQNSYLTEIIHAKADFRQNLAAERRLGGPARRSFFDQVTHAANTFDRFSAEVTRAYDRHQYLAAQHLHLGLEHPQSHVLEAQMRSLIASAKADFAGAQASYTSGWNSLRLILLIFSLTSLILALLLGLVLSWAMVLPVRRISAALSAIAGGNFRQQVAVPNHDEFGDLARDLNRTSAELDRLYGELRAATTNLEEARDQALDANRTKSAFLANMSHELRTPLNAIIGYTELLIEDAEDVGQEETLPDLQRIRSSGKHLLALINDVLDLSKIEAGKMDLFLATFDVAAVVRDVSDTVRPIMESKQAAFDLHLAPGLGEMHADETKVRQVLFNLLSNAAKFAGGKQVRLVAERGRVPAVGAGEWLRFTVADTGIGMTAEQMGRLFQAFSQADSSIHAKYGGTGLGLALSRRFCELMGGEIYVDSRPGEGTTFRVLLPSVVPEHTPAGTGEDTPAATPPVPASSNGHDTAVAGTDALPASLSPQA